MAILENWFTSITMYEFLITLLVAAAIWVVFKHYYNKRRLFQLGSKLPGPKPWPIIGNAWHFLGTKSGAEWKKARKLSQPAVDYSAVKNSIPVIETQGDILIQRLQVEVGKPNFPILPYLKDLLFDTMGEILVEFDEKAQKSEMPLLNEVDQFIKLVHNRMYNPLYQVEFLYRLLPEGKKFYSLLNSIFTYANNIIIGKMDLYKEEKKKQIINGNSEKTKKQIFWKTLMDDETLSVSDMRDHIFSLMLGAYDATTSAISSVLMMLALHPDVQERTYQEIISITNGNFNDEKIEKLKYLDMVTKESMRLLPPVPTTLRKATEDIQIGDHLIPAGADVSLNIFELHRDPDQYENPNEFNPNNFLPENVAKRHAYSFLPFAGGQRKCAGAKLSMMIIKIIVAKILLNYKVECGYKKIEDIKFKGDLTLVFQDKVRVRLLERQ